MADSVFISSFFDRPEIQELFHSVFSTLMEESDRGAVLIGASHVDLHLRNLFETIGPQSMSRRELRRTLDYPGPLSTLSAKADVALLTRLISDHVHQAIHHLRRIRNDVAHSPDAFRLADHQHRLREMYELLGPGLPSAINRLAAELILRTAVESVLEVNDPASDEPKPIFKNSAEVLDHFAKDTDLMATLDERRPKCELALGVSFICSLIVYHRDGTKDLIGDSNMPFLTMKR